MKDNITKFEFRLYILDDYGVVKVDASHPCDLKDLLKLGSIRRFHSYLF